MISSIAGILLSICLINSEAASWERWGPEYESKSASEKLDSIWSEVISQTSPGQFPSALQILGIFFESMQPSLQWVGDTFQQEKGKSVRRKFIHSVGNVARVKFIPRSNTASFTGIFKDGADYGLIRLSLAKKPVPSKSTAEGAVDNFAPGFGLKFLRDGIPSANLVAMYSVNGQNSWNFFANNFTTKINSAQGPVLKLVEAKFKTATPIPGHVGTSDWAQYDQKGNKIENPVFPYYLIFEPNPEIKALFSDSYTTDFQAQLASIPEGVILYKVYGLPEPNSTPVYIGDLQITSHLTSSKFGDQYLFFKHQDILEDFKFRPDWNDGVKVIKKCPYSK